MNKQIGTAFERQVCELFARQGFWVHFLSPDRQGAQPFDILAVKDGNAIPIECKTCKSEIFRIDRLEENQRLAFDKWLECGNAMPVIAIKRDDRIAWIRYDILKEYGRCYLS